jgi:PPOX class probable F420-dependent enzyme
MAARTLDELPGWAAELLATARVAHLGLLDGGGGPRVLPVTFARLGDELWSAIDDKPKRRSADRLARVRWLKARPRSALTIDRYDEDWSELAWVQVVGQTAVLEQEGHEPVLAALAERYAQYRERPPAGPLLRLTPERVVFWRAAPDA